MKGIFLTLIISLVVACEKELPLPKELPPITEEGKNTFGCLIENEIYVPEKRQTVWSIPGPQYKPIEFSFPEHPSYFFRVSTIRLVDKENDLSMDAMVEFIVDSSISKIGRYHFSHTTVKYENEYYYSDTMKGWLNISKYDTINGIISGTFNFSAIDKNNTNSKIINVTNGRFDLKKQ